VEDTLPRKHRPYSYDHLTSTIEAAKEAGENLQNPVQITMEVLRRGQGLYSVYCMLCHGSRGEGDGPVIGAGRFPAPPSLHTEQSREYTDGTIYHIMTKGLGKMPSYADKLEPDERWMIVHYLHALQRSMAPKPEDLTP
jgi:mono/diheme cytochrome c family protein